MPPTSGLELFGQSPSDLVEHEPHERLSTTDVGGRHNEVERGGPLAFYEVSDPPVAPARDLGDDRITVEAEKAHGGGGAPRGVVLGPVRQLPGPGGDHAGGAFP